MNILDLPPEMQDQILMFLPAEELMRLASFSAQLGDIIRQNKVLLKEIQIYLNRNSRAKQPQKWYMWAAKNGNVELLYCLYSIFPLSENEARPLIKYIFNNVSKLGKLKVLQWAHSKLRVSRNDLNLAFRWATMYGHLGILLWLNAAFNLSNEDIGKFPINAFPLAAEYGQLHVLTWLNGAFDIRRSDALSAFYLAATSGRCRALNILVWLHHNFNFAKEEIHRNDEVIFEESKKRDLEVYRWLQSNF
jgi:hypothetical protein